jgi:hypothetical protein
MKAARLSALRTGRLYPPGNIPGDVGTIKSMKNSNDNRTRDLSAYSAVPQPTAPPRAPCINTGYNNEYITVCNTKCVSQTCLSNSVPLLKPQCINSLNNYKSFPQFCEQNHQRGKITDYTPKPSTSSVYRSKYSVTLKITRDLHASFVPSYLTWR